jgi:plastocyanin
MHGMRAKAAVVLLAIATVAAPASAIAGAGSGGAGSPGSGVRAASSHVVVLKGLRFHPSKIVIKRGESVTWLWRDGGIEHNVTAHGFHSRTQEHGSFTVRFSRAGTFNYHCTIHVSQGMVGKVIVH